MGQASIGHNFSAHTRWSPIAAQGNTQSFRPIDVWTRAGTGIVGASNSVITAEDIARSPATTLQDVLSREAGIQIEHAGGNNGATTSVDLRGFGATASSNSLFLLNGRRLNDIDLQGVDFSSIPKDSIERIEITRGNSGAVLYGDGAVGGVINIVTKTGIIDADRERVEAVLAHSSLRRPDASAAVIERAMVASGFGNAINSDGYRVNNALRQRKSVGDLRYTGSEVRAVQYRRGWAAPRPAGRPGGSARQSSAHARYAVAPPRRSFATRKQAIILRPVSRELSPGVELIVDGDVRRKFQRRSSQRCSRLFLLRIT